MMKISFTPTGTYTATDALAALTEVDSNKCAKTGDNITGNWTVSGTVGVGTALPLANLHVYTGGILSSPTLTAPGGFRHYYDTQATSYAGIYNNTLQKFISLTANIPQPAGTLAIGALDQGLAVQGLSTGTSSIFSVLNSSQTTFGLGSANLTVLGNGAIFGVRNTLDDGTGAARFVSLALGTSTATDTIPIPAGGSIGVEFNQPTAVTLTQSVQGGGTLVSGTTYYYKIVVFDGLGYSRPISEYSITLTGSNNAVNVAWVAPTEANSSISYRVYRGTASNAQTGWYYSYTSPYLDTGVTFGSSGGSALGTPNTQSNAHAIRFALGTTWLYGTNFGLGTTTPQRTLHVRQGTGLNGIVSGDTDTSYGALTHKYTGGGSNDYLAIYDVNNSFFFGFCLKNPNQNAITDASGTTRSFAGFSPFFKGLVLYGASNGTAVPLFGIRNSAQNSGYGINNIGFTVLDNNTVFTYKNTLDDGSGNALIAGTLGVTGNLTAPTQTAGDNTTKVATTAFVTAALSSLGSSLPSQTGNSGKYLTTDGSVASWAAINLSSYVTNSSLATSLSSYTLSSTLGTLSTQNANAAAITGGTINGTVIGGSIPAAGSFTSAKLSGATAAAVLSMASGSALAVEFSNPTAITATPTTGGSMALGTYYYRISVTGLYGDTVATTEASVTLSGSNNAISFNFTPPSGINSTFGYWVYLSTTSGSNYFRNYYNGGASRPFVVTTIPTSASTPNTTNTGAYSVQFAAGTSYLYGTQLGIGIGAPLAALHIQAGTLLSGDTSTSQGALYQRYTGGTTNDYFALWNNSDSQYIGFCLRNPNQNVITDSSGTTRAFTGFSSFFKGLVLYGASNGTATSIFAIRNNAQNSGFGNNNCGFTVLDNNTVLTFKNILDDGSGNLTLGGVLFPVKATTALAPAYVKGGLYFDTTLNKMRIGGATAWETVTSA
jgi:hypothetical protein